MNPNRRSTSNDLRDTFRPGHAAALGTPHLGTQDRQPHLDPVEERRTVQRPSSDIASDIASRIASALRSWTGFWRSGPRARAMGSRVSLPEFVRPLGLVP